MSNTPETDAETFKTMRGDDKYGWRWSEGVPADFARKIERERDAARENLTQTQKAWTDVCIERTKFAIERDEARQAFATATNHAIAAREMLRRIMDWAPCLPDYEPDAQHLKWQSDAHAARKFLEAAK